VERCTLDIVYGSILIHNDQRTLELAHIGGVQPENACKAGHFDAFWHVDERSTRPDRRVSAAKLVVSMGMTVAKYSRNSRGADAGHLR